MLMHPPSPKQPRLISKSSYMVGQQCPKYLWHWVNQREIFPEADAATQGRFDQGKEVGELAKTLFPKGIEIGAGIVKLATVDELSRATVPQRRPMFEAGFITGRAFARADVLVPVAHDQWDLCEVKSTSSTKDEHLPEVAMQRYVYEGAGLRIRRCFVIHLNGDYVRKGEIDVDQLLTRSDVTDEIQHHADVVRSELKKMVSTIDQERPPEVRVGPHCEAPRECPLMDTCWKALPKHNIFTLAGLGRQAYGWFDKGVTRLQDLPDDIHLTPKQRVQVRAVRSRTTHVNADGLREFLDQLTYPLHFLDFETINPAVPAWDMTSPYQQVPFQFSLVVVPSPGAKPIHHAFLAEDASDPRPMLLAHLKAHLGQRGSILAYCAGFETRVLESLSKAFPSYASWWKKLRPRMVDLLKPFRAFDYYHRDQCGSASLKAVLPALTGKDYSDLLIADGNAASQEFMRITFDQVSAAERKRVRAALEKYCALDASGMLDIVKALRKLV